MKFLAGLFAAASLVAAEEFRVIVGKNAAGEVANVFEPSQVTAKVGDIIHFEFRAKNHTVTQSSFAEPCTQQFNTVTQLPGVDSGFQFVDPAASEIPVWSIQIEQDQAPIWMFCARAPHCNGGMVFAINAPTEGERTFATFFEKAATANHPEYGTTADFTPPAPAAPPAGGDQQVTDPALDPNAPPAADPNAPPADPNAPPADPNAPPADPNAPPAAGAPSVPPIAATGTEVLVPVVPPTPGVVPPAENAAPGTPDSESANSGAFKVTGGVASGLFAVVAAAMLF